MSLGESPVAEMEVAVLGYGYEEVVGTEAGDVGVCGLDERLRGESVDIYILIRYRLDSTDGDFGLAL